MAQRSVEELRFAFLKAVMPPVDQAELDKIKQEAQSLGAEGEALVRELTNLQRILDKERSVRSFEEKIDFSQQNSQRSDKAMMSS